MWKAHPKRHFASPAQVPLQVTGIGGATVDPTNFLTFTFNLVIFSPHFPPTYTKVAQILLFHPIPLAHSIFSSFQVRAFEWSSRIVMQGSEKLLCCRPGQGYPGVPLAWPQPLQFHRYTKMSLKFHFLPFLHFLPKITHAMLYSKCLANISSQTWWYFSSWKNFIMKVDYADSKSAIGFGLGPLIAEIYH